MSSHQISREPDQPVEKFEPPDSEDEEPRHGGIIPEFRSDSGEQNPEKVNFAPIANIVVEKKRQGKDGYTAVVTESGKEGTGKSPGRALASLASKVIADEEDTKYVESQLLELAGLVSNEEARHMKEAVKRSTRAEKRRDKNISLTDTSDE